MSILRTDQIQSTTGLPILKSTGSIIQVVYGDMGSNTSSISSQDLSVIPNCSVTITPTRSSSKILLISHIVHNGWYVCSFGFSRSGSIIGGNGNTNVSSGSIATFYMGHSSTTDQGWCLSTTIQYLDSPATTSAITYSPMASSSWAGAIYNITINDRIGANMRSLTSITAMEIVA